MEIDGQAMPESQTRSPDVPVDKLQALLNAHRGERHVIVLQDYPDPDALSSAFAHQLISAQFDITADIVYRGRISHQQNTALVKILGIELRRFEPNMDLGVYQGAVLVDNQGSTANAIMTALQAANVPILAVVDHHEAQERPAVPFVDIRRTGATATIYAEYLQQGLLPMDGSRKEHVLVATALMHGIMTDTGNFIHAKPEDFYAAAFLSQYRDAELITQVMSQARSKQTMEIIRLALGNRVIVENFSVAGIGYLRAVDRDAIPQAADFLLTEENVHTSLVYGILIGDDGSESLIGSMRTRKLTLDLDEFIKDVFGKDAAGRYFGGGKLSAAGFEIPIGFLAGGTNKEYQELKWQAFDAQVKQKILTRIGVNSADMAKYLTSPSGQRQ